MADAVSAEPEPASTWRPSMQWLHTWGGVVLGSVLFAMFWMGTLSVFDREIDRWMMPATRIAPTEVPRAPSLDAVLRDARASLPADVTQIGVTLPTSRAPAMRVGYVPDGGEYTTRWADPRSGRLLPEQGTHAGTGFIFPFHFMLHLKWKQVGYWIAGLAAMAMLALLVSGVVIHRKIFADFFLFRPRKRLQRSALDLHNMTGVLALPFHFAMALSGLVIFIGIYYPQARTLAYQGEANPRDAWYAEAYGQYRREPAGRPASAAASVDAMAAEATRRWQGGVPYFVRVWHPNDANAYVELRRSYAHDVTMHLDTVFFDAASGAPLSHFEATPTMNVQRFLSGLHFIQFEHWPLRWLYFALGLSGCVMIATGFLFWIEARRVRHAKLGLRGVAVVHGLTVGSVSGIVVATLVFFVANRLLPADAAVGPFPRETLEMWAFYGAWLLTFAHAWWRPRAAWREQAWAIAALALAAVALNALTTGDHPLRAAQRGLWAVAGMDAMLIAAALFAAGIALRLRRRAAADAPALRAAAVDGKSAASAALAARTASTADGGAA